MAGINPGEVEGQDSGCLIVLPITACMYVFRWTYLIDKYNLTSNQTDLAKIADVESACKLN